MPQKKPPGLKRGREASLHADFLLGTFLPFARASESPIAMACFLDLTVLPLLLLLSAPVFRRLIARLTSPDADLEYRAIIFSSRESQNADSERRFRQTRYSYGWVSPPPAGRPLVYSHNHCVVDFAPRAASSAPSTIPLLSTCLAKWRVHSSNAASAAGSFSRLSACVSAYNFPTPISA